MHQVNETNFRQHVVKSLASQVLGLIQVNIYISQHNEVLTMEARQGLLYIREVGQHARRKVCYND